MRSWSKKSFLKFRDEPSLWQTKKRALISSYYDRDKLIKKMSFTFNGKVIKPPKSWLENILTEHPTNSFVFWEADEKENVFCDAIKSWF